MYRKLSGLMMASHQHKGGHFIKNVIKQLPIKQKKANCEKISSNKDVIKDIYSKHRERSNNFARKENGQ